MGGFEDVHGDRITGSLTMFDRMIFKGYLTRLYPNENVRCFLWTQGVEMRDFTEWAKATTERIANNARKLVTDAGRPVISFDHVKTRNRAQRKDELAKKIAEEDGITEGIVCLISAVETLKRLSTASWTRCRSGRNAAAAASVAPAVVHAELRPTAAPITTAVAA